MPKFSWERCVRMLAVVLGILHISFVIMMIILSIFLMLKDCIVCVCNVEFMIMFKTLVFCFRLARDVASSLPCCLILFVLFLALWG